VDVGHLYHGQQREQHQTHEYSCPGCVLLPAAAASTIWLESRQSTIPRLKDTSIGRASRGSGCSF
jgi:hypothetical protein